MEKKGEFYKLVDMQMQAPEIIGIGASSRADVGELT